MTGGNQRVVDSPQRETAGDSMTASVAIGEFSRLTHLTVKTLRHYHDQGLLVPYAVDEQSGYRRYSIDQVPAALLIGRLRALDMPLADVRRVVDSGDSRERDAVIAEHLGRMERQLIPDLTVVAVAERVDRSDIGAWCEQTFTSLYTGLTAAEHRRQALVAHCTRRISSPRPSARSRRTCPSTRRLRLAQHAP